MHDLLDDQLKRINTALSDIIEETSHIVHLKDVQTGRYIQSSPGFAEKLELESKDDVIGLTVDDLVTSPKIWGDKNFSQAFVQWRAQQPEIFKNFDRKVQAAKCRSSQETLFFSPEGDISIQNTLKIPIFDQNAEKVIAIYTYARDTTFQRSLPELLNLYLEFYPQKQAFQHLLMYLEIDGYFNELPNPEEMKILFSIHQNPNISDAIAHSAHFFSLREKIEKGDWQEMWIRLCAIPTI